MHPTRSVIQLPPKVLSKHPEVNRRPMTKQAPIHLWAKRIATSRQVATFPLLACPFPLIHLWAKAYHQRHPASKVTRSHRSPSTKTHTKTPSLKNHTMTPQPQHQKSHESTQHQKSYDDTAAPAPKVTLKHPAQKTTR